MVDECHRAKSTEFKKVFKVEAPYTLGLSATPENTDDEDVPPIESYNNGPAGRALGPIIYDYSLSDCLRDELLAQFEVYHVALPLNSEENLKYVKLSREISDLRQELMNRYSKANRKGGFMAFVHGLAKEPANEGAIRFISLTSDRKMLLYKAMSRSILALSIVNGAMLESDSRVMIFHERISEINDLYRTAFKTHLPVVLEHSNLTANLRTLNIESFRKGEARIIVSAKSLVEGFNVPSADIGIIAASSTSVRQRIQSLGRMLRKKESQGSAKIFVFYIKDTVDEEIYEKADWENVIGAKRNRYFEWTPTEDSTRVIYSLEEIIDQFKELDGPPKMFRPTLSEDMFKGLSIGDVYTGQIKGEEARIDVDKNLKTNSGKLIQASDDIMKQIQSLNLTKRAVLIKNKYLVCRESKCTNPDKAWKYLGEVKESKSSENSEIEKLSFNQHQGKLVVGRREGRNIYYARDKSKAVEQKAGETLENLIKWMIDMERQHQIKIHSIYWNKDTKYWIEIYGKQYYFDQNNARLEFPN